jgi:hypothetical protein
MENKTYFIIAKSGDTENPEITKVIITSEDEDFDSDFKDFDEYVDYILNDVIDEYSQQFISAIVLTEEQYNFVKLASSFNTL